MSTTDPSSTSSSDHIEIDTEQNLIDSIEALDDLPVVNGLPATFFTPYLPQSALTRQGESLRKLRTQEAEIVAQQERSH
jgi:hypothetical protein